MKKWTKDHLRCNRALLKEKRELIQNSCQCRCHRIVSPSPFSLRKAKKPLRHSHFRTLRNAIVQQRSARSNVMVNISCRTHSYSTLRASRIILLASASSIAFFKLPRAAPQKLHSWSQFSFFICFPLCPALVPVWCGGGLSVQCLGLTRAALGAEQWQRPLTNAARTAPGKGVERGERFFGCSKKQW